MPYEALQIIVPPCGEVSNAPPVSLPNSIVGHTPIKVCSVVAVEMITVDGANIMICCGQIVSNMVSVFLHDYGGGCVTFLLVFCLVIPGSCRIFILFPSAQSPSCCAYTQVCYILTIKISRVRYYRCPMKSGTLRQGGR